MNSFESYVQYKIRQKYRVVKHNVNLLSKDYSLQKIASSCSQRLLSAKDSNSLWKKKKKEKEKEKPLKTDEWVVRK